MERKKKEVEIVGIAFFFFFVGIFPIYRVRFLNLHSYFKNNICFSLSRLSFQIKDLEIRKFKDKYLFCVFFHNKFPICGEMAGRGDSGSQMGFRTAFFGGFSCGFNIVGRFMRRAKQWVCAGVGPIK